MRNLRYLSTKFPVFLVACALCLPVHSQQQTPQDSQNSDITSPRPDPEFSLWLQELIDEARERGISDRILDQALTDVTPIPQVVSNDRNQAEFVETFIEYRDKRVTDWRIDKGREMLAEHKVLLDRVAETYGVQPRFILAFWGLETNYGTFPLEMSAIRALVTLAYDPRRADYFRRELFSALQILQEGHIALDEMKGSWAGAMGQTQFMPSNFLRFAQDFDGDGKRDIWNSTADVLASIAYYLQSNNWRDDQTWGREVTLPADFYNRRDQWEQESPSYSCGALRSHSVQRTLPEWQAFGLRQADGSDLPAVNFSASIVAPDSESGPAYVTYGNFRSILRYNCANKYALSVGLLADTLHID
ncbi:MAG: lytic murein transglycosylase [Pseudohongiellaceae bacterium]